MAANLLQITQQHGQHSTLFKRSGFDSASRLTLHVPGVVAWRENSLVRGDGAARLLPQPTAVPPARKPQGYAGYRA
ncbi:hypothetical protein EPA93_12005 [Ktedonosporobacter rubrisoli]|uniref:Uncharacterized protein n=1 Tax=Ktedonosporobacter rubrisoli TaxID=2509675 RepID=A0A4P6JPJ1_KTERU|nr:hypothetical protein [Ktedonosporobacter rubrisoli]QBD76686.1 hypothetical protein EPA93_12005 [Ktedonosporobacter rubrisoli]